MEISVTVHMDDETRVVNTFFPESGKCEKFGKLGIGDCSVFFQNPGQIDKVVDELLKLKEEFGSDGNKPDDKRA